MIVNDPDLSFSLDQVPTPLGSVQMGPVVFNTAGE